MPNKSPPKDTATRGSNGQGPREGNASATQTRKKPPGVAIKKRIDPTVSGAERRENQKERGKKMRAGRATKGHGPERKLRVGPVAETSFQRCAYCHGSLSIYSSMESHLNGIPGLSEDVKEAFRCEVYRAGASQKNTSPVANR